MTNSVKSSNKGVVIIVANMRDLLIYLICIKRENILSMCLFCQKHFIIMTYMNINTLYSLSSWAIILKYVIKFESPMN